MSATHDTTRVGDDVPENGSVGHNGCDPAQEGTDLAPEGAQHSTSATEKPDTGDAARARQLELLEEIASLLRSQPRLIDKVAVDIGEAADLLGVSRTFFDKHIRPMLRTMEIGRRTLVSIDELRAFCIRESALHMKGTRR